MRHEPLNSDPLGLWTSLKAANRTGKAVARKTRIISVQDWSKSTPSRVRTAASDDVHQHCQCPVALCVASRCVRTDRCCSPRPKRVRITGGRSVDALYDALEHVGLSSIDAMLETRAVTRGVIFKYCQRQTLGNGGVMRRRRCLRYEPRCAAPASRPWHTGSEAQRSESRIRMPAESWR